MNIYYNMPECQMYNSSSIVLGGLILSWETVRITRHKQPYNFPKFYPNTSKQLEPVQHSLVPYTSHLYP